MSSRRGADWLIADTAPTDVFTPDAFSDEHRLIRKTAGELLQQDILPATDELEKKNWGLARSLIQRCGSVGLLGIDVPDEFGGVDLDKVSSVIVAESLGVAASFSTTFGAQTGLAIIPILWFGTPGQKQKYLPRLVTGELIGAYCLSESGSGSDAQGARTRATRQPDGSWRLTGEKMWVTNGGFADLFIVFAKVDGEHFSAFIVEHAFPGVSSGQEEHKMGLQGSSTTPVILQDAQVPAANLLGDVGKGHKIAFNVLNYGRFKLAAMCSGGAKRTIREAATYAAARQQFGRPIAAFGAIRHKIAEMTIRTYALESTLYRTAGLVDAAIAAGLAPAAALEEFAVEASLLKVAGSEIIDFVTDESVQIHGGNGFVRDYPAERHYRDVRVNRIFEGTNEINRLLVPGLIVKRALKSGLPQLAAIERLQDETTPAGAGDAPDRPGAALGGATQSVQSLKATALLLLSCAMRTYGDALAEEQEVLMLAADVILDAFTAESAVLRAARLASADSAVRPGSPPDLACLAASVVAHDAGRRAGVSAHTALAAMAPGEASHAGLTALTRVHRVAPFDTIGARRRLADAVVERKGYVFGE
jgi:alkylation response protein AidB-like acyl-CoA dehydrogenase